MPIKAATPPDPSNYKPFDNGTEVVVIDQQDCPLLSNFPTTQKQATEQFTALLNLAYKHGYQYSGIRPYQVGVQSRTHIVFTKLPTPVKATTTRTQKTKEVTK